MTQETAPHNLTVSDTGALKMRIIIHYETSAYPHVFDLDAGSFRSINRQRCYNKHQDPSLLDDTPKGNIKSLTFEGSDDELSALGRALSGVLDDH